MRNRPAEQIYENYTAEDFQVWKILFDRQMENLEGKVAEEFLAALETVEFRNDRIPNFKEVNRILAGQTGWQIVTVPNISPAEEFFSLLANRKFTATCWLRAMEELDYLEEPDMFHDVFAHTPLLSNTAYTDFFQRMGKLALRYIEHPELVRKLQRLYWFTIEFGLIRNAGKLKIYGAGIISSKGETAHALGNASTKHEYDVARIFDHDFRTDIIQEEYYVIDSFEQLTASFPQIEELLENSLTQALSLSFS